MKYDRIFISICTRKMTSIGKQYNFMITDTSHVGVVLFLFSDEDEEYIELCSCPSPHIG